MQKITFRFLVLLVALVSIQLQAQKRPVTNGFHMEYNQASRAFFEESGYVKCATVEYNQALRQQHPEIGTEDQFESWMSQKIQELRAQRAANPTNTTDVITIPVVIHIIHNGEPIGTAPNITDAQAMSQITVMNEDYRRLLGSRGYNTHPDGADVEIEFCLASTDPNGNPTNGIDRQNLGQSSWSTTAINSTVKPNTIWDPTKYMNMWTVNFSDTTLLGYAQFPNNSGLPGLNANNGNANTDGVVANYNAFGSMDHDDGTFIMNNTYQYGRTMTHEVGHFLGLRHTWGDGDCSVDDYCDDTPNSGDANYGCPTGTDSCAGGDVDMIENYMDYTDDDCMNIFTKDQKDRILIVMQNSPRRVELVTSSVCSGFNMELNGDPTGTCAPDNGIISFNYEPVGGFAETVTFSASGNPSGTSVSFNPSSASTATTVQMTVSGITSAMQGDHVITITGTGTSLTKTIDATLSVFSTGANTVSLQTPANAATDIPLAPTLSWTADTNALNYNVQVATDVNFNTLVVNTVSGTNSYTVSPALSPTTTYYWRVQSNNSCGASSYSGTFSFTTANPDYCTSTYTESGSEYILNVSFNTIDNDSGDENADGYEDYTGISTDIEANSTYTLSVTINTAGNYLDHCFAFIDWNRDFVFDNATERIDLGNIANVTAGVLSADVLVPATAASGSTLMRVLIEYEDATDGVGQGACNEDHLTGWGETEDYSVNIINNTAAVHENMFNSFTLYPNPSDGLFHLELESDNNSNLQVELYDTRGRLLRSSQINSNGTSVNTNLDYSAINTGIYLLKVTKGNQIGVQQLIIK